MSGSNKDWIQSASGLKVDLLNPDSAVIKIEDIAKALSKLCRYTGHTSRFYSVAEHSVRVSYRAEDLARHRHPIDWHFRDVVARWGLLHDASEAYLGDLSRPLKNIPAIAAAYKPIEKLWMKAIAKRFGLDGEEPPEVTRADQEMLGPEAHQLMQPVHPEWGLTCPSGSLPPAHIDGIGRLGWDSEQAEDRFLMRFKDLFE